MTFYEQCWEYHNPNDNGYGPHRVVYEILAGPIPEGLDLDHLCRNRACYNPTHLEPVTRSENLRRGDTWSPEVQARRSETSRRNNTTPEAIERARENATRRGVCDVCGYESVESWVTRHKKKVGHG